MTADATPGGRPQYAAPRDEIAPPLAPAGAARHAKTGLLSEQLSQAPAQNLRFATTAIKDRASRRHPTRREVPLGTRKLGFSLNYFRKLRPKTCDSQQAAICDRASRRHPTRREVPLGTRIRLCLT